MVDYTPEIFTSDYTGRPGERTFFLQGRGDVTLSYLVEKQQVVLLAEKLRDILLLVDPEDIIISTTPARDPAFRLEAPIEPEWRVGSMGLGYIEETDQVVVSMAPVTEGEGEGEVEGEEVPEELDEDRFEVRFMLSRDQVRSFVRHTLAIVEEGRPLCQLCGLPMDPDGHLCPASNGHHPASV
jgi:uncharacterized repeat protein (TIGR03847 family)